MKKVLFGVLVVMLSASTVFAQTPIEKTVAEGKQYQLIIFNFPPNSAPVVSTVIIPNKKMCEQAAFNIKEYTEKLSESPFPTSRNPYAACHSLSK